MPIVLTSATASNLTTPTLTAPVASSAWSYAGLKNGYYNILHGADLTIAGKTVEQFQPNLNVYTNFKLLSQMSQDDLKSLGNSLGMGECLDNAQSLRFNYAGGQAGSATAYPASSTVTAGLVGGNGLVNNQPFSLTAAGNFGDQTGYGVQSTGAYNNGYFSRLKKIVDTSNASAAGQNNLYSATSGSGAAAAAVMSPTNLSNEFKPYATVLNTNYAVVYDVAVIRLCDIFDSMKNLCLMKKFDGILRLYFNTGAVGSTMLLSATAGITGTMTTSASTNTFTNTCPIIQSCLSNSAYTTGSIGIVSGLSIAKAGPTNIFNINLANSGASHFLPSCRVYYPQVQLKPEKLIPYISENRAKKIVYTSFLYNQFNGITSGSTYSALVQSGVSNIRGVLIIPFQSGTTNGSVNTTATTGSFASGVTTFAQTLSPFDTAPATNAPISLLNLQVSVGGTNVLQNTLNYTYENFLQQVSLYDKINSSDIGLSCGLINEYYWSNAYRTYYCDCTRGNIGDLLTARNVNLTFTNNSNLTIDVMVFTEYFTEMVVDVETGQVSK